MPNVQTPPLRQRRYWSPPVALAFSYLIFSVAWILVTDNVASRFAGHLPLYNELQHAKGLLFVCFSSLLIFLATRTYYLRMRTRHRENKALLARYDMLHRAIREAIIDYDFGSGTAIVNETMLRLLGDEVPRINGFADRFLAQVHPGDRERVRQQLRHFAAVGGAEWISRFKFRSTQDGYRDMRVQGLVLHDAETGEPQHMVFAMSDETDMLDARAQLLYQQMLARQEQSRSVIAAEERERERWAHELHDNVCQLLTAAGLLLAQSANEDPMQARVRDLVSRSLNEIRQLSAAILPPEFAEDTLAESIISLVSNIQRIVDIELRLNLEEGLEEKLSAEHKLMIYRIVQEQLNNIVKYAAATTVTVTASLYENVVQLSVADDGKGFDPGTVGAGIGLRNIRSRLQVYSGTLDINSAPGAGCTLQATFMLPS
jgi:two-component system sensor histidine kinase UhpB